MPEKTVTSVTGFDNGIWRKFPTVLWKETTWTAEKREIGLKKEFRFLWLESHRIQMGNMEQNLWILRKSHRLVLP